MRVAFTWASRRVQVKTLKQYANYQELILDSSDISDISLFEKILSQYLFNQWKKATNNTMKLQIVSKKKDILCHDAGLEVVDLLGRQCDLVCWRITFHVWSPVRPPGFQVVALFIYFFIL